MYIVYIIFNDFIFNILIIDANNFVIFNNTLLNLTFYKLSISNTQN